MKKKLEIPISEKRQKNSIKASKILKFEWINHNETFEDNQLDKYSLLKITHLMKKLKKM